MSLKVVKFAAKKKDMIQLAENGGSPKWYWMSGAVQGFAHKAIKAGDEVTIEGNEEKDNLTIITKISKAGSGSSGTSLPETTNTGTTGFVCEDCGKALKDGKYKKCFVCNKKTPKKETSGGSYSKSPEVGEAIMKQSVLKSVCSVMPALIGNVDRNDIGDVIEALYDRLYAKLNK